MANKLYEESNIQAIANAIRAKGQTGTMTVAQMPSKIAGIKTKSTYTWHQCPTAVKNYIDNVTYNPSDYTTSQIASYAPATPVASNTKPIGKTVDGVTYYNEIPNIDTPFSSANEAGTVKPLDRLRWINSKTSNMRDLGGWSCDGGTVKYGLIYRAGNLSADDEDLFLNKLAIRQEIDLRGADESTQSVFGNKIRYVSADGVDTMYIISNTDSWRVYIKALFDSVIVEDAVVFHCSMGADRTGTFACIIEGLLGVSQSDCDKDYELTSFISERARNKNYQGGTSDWAHLMQRINALSGDTFRDKCVNFVASLGFTAEEINAFRRAMIDGNPETVTPSIATYTVTKGGSNVTFSNPAASVDQYQPYECDITPADGYLIESVSVTMNGVDITESCFDGDFVNSGEIDITSNGSVSVDGYKTANVNVPQGITPAGTKNITENGTYDVTDFASAVVNVQGVASGSVTLAQSASISVNTGLQSATHFVLIQQGTPTTNRGFFAYARSASAGFALYRTSSGVTCYDSEYTTNKISLSISNGVVSISNAAFAFAAETYSWFAW